jgi:hypothetical protein
VALPVAWLFQYMPKNHALGRGLADGRDSAVRDAQRPRTPAPIEPVDNVVPDLADARHVAALT